MKANRSVDQETRQKIRGMLDELNLVDGQWSDALKKEQENETLKYIVGEIAENKKENADWLTFRVEKDKL